jgi:hypothetical protein
VMQSLNQSEFYHQLMNYFIRIGNGEVADSFKYKGFTRFSPKICPITVGELSISVRSLHKDAHNKKFLTTFESENYETDFCRVPTINDSELGQKLKNYLCQIGPLLGQLPIVSNEDLSFKN